MLKNGITIAFAKNTLNISKTKPSNFFVNLLRYYDTKPASPNLLSKR